jgi:hypothetical protein
MRRRILAQCRRITAKIPPLIATADIASSDRRSLFEIARATINKK